ncbi:hypothetical protein B0H11DRAFT_1903825 [Mycena galericulata]|nr:hypothetical protein B0H11DRAFT_1903825 [Mycena galericulata]
MVLLYVRTPMLPTSKGGSRCHAVASRDSMDADCAYLSTKHTYIVINSRQFDFIFATPGYLLPVTHRNPSGIIIEALELLRNLFGSSATRELHVCLRYRGPQSTFPLKNNLEYLTTCGPCQEKAAKDRAARRARAMDTSASRAREDTSIHCGPAVQPAKGRAEEEQGEEEVTIHVLGQRGGSPAARTILTQPPSNQGDLENGTEKDHDSVDHHGRARVRQGAECHGRARARIGATDRNTR